MIDGVPDLSTLLYEPKNFRDLAETDLGRALWSFLKRPDNLIRMQTAVLLERVAVEPLANGLIFQFGEKVSDERTKQMIGHMARQIMEALGYEHERGGVSIPRIGLFSSGAKYKRPRNTDHSMKITRDERQAWIKNAAKSPFIRWLNEQVQRSDGTVDLEWLYEVARPYGIENKEERLNPAQQCMNVGEMLRDRVPPEIYKSI